MLEPSRIAFIYADESLIEIEGKKHIIVGAIHPDDPGKKAIEVVRLKERNGLGPLDEIKWNTKGLTKDQRERLTNGIINILNFCTGFIALVEGEDKQKATEILTLQI